MNLFSGESRTIHRWILSGKHPTEELKAAKRILKNFTPTQDDLLNYSSHCYSKESIWVSSKGIQLAKTLLWNSGDTTDHTSEAGLCVTPPPSLCNRTEFPHVTEESSMFICLRNSTVDIMKL